jgi:hypothetical protein
MKILFVHQNFPAQFRSLASALAQGGLAEVVAIGDFSAAGRRAAVAGVRLITYDYPLPATGTAP